MTGTADATRAINGPPGTRRTPASRALRLAVAALLAVIATVAVPGRAAAALPGISFGFANDTVLFNPAVPAPGGAATQSYWAGQAAGLGAGVLRVTTYWYTIAPVKRPNGFVASNPASPGYHWGPVDQAVRIFAAHHLQMLFTTVWAPTWAENGVEPAYVGNPPVPTYPGSWQPDPGQLAAFATAAAKRYSGHFPDPLYPGHYLPRIKFWQGWNEPNLGYYLLPQWNAQGQPVAPNWYRKMQNAFYHAVKKVNRSNVVITAGTAPYGNPPNSTTPLDSHVVTGLRMSPVLFYRTLFCITPGGHSAAGCPGPTYTDGIDQHLYQIPPPQKSAYRSTDVGVPDFGRITPVLAAGVRYHHVLPTAHKSVWAGEISWDSNPPSDAPGAAPVLDQACYYELSLYLLWHQGVSNVLLLQIRDDPSRNYAASFEWGGPFFSDGQPKPSATALYFPLVAWRTNRAHVTVWGRAPQAGTLTIYHRLSSGRLVALAHLRVSYHQVFQTAVRLRGAVDVVGQVGSSQSLPWVYSHPTCPSHPA